VLGPPRLTSAKGPELRNLPVAIERQQRRERWAAAVFAIALGAILFTFGALEPMENRLLEARSRFLDRSPTGQVAIVEIDAKSLAAINSWPWSRRYHAELVKRLGHAGASIIAFDVDFSARSDPAGDEALADALHKIQPVILPIFQQRASDSETDKMMIKSRPAQLFNAAWVGGVNILPGHDGVVRDFPAATMINGQAQPAMAALLADNGSLGDRTFIPDWSIDATRIPRFSFVDVIQGRVPAKLIAGKRIIVGATAIEMGDRYPIPRFGTVPGVVVQALAAESLLQHRTITRSGLLPTLGGLCLIGLVFGAGFRRALPLVGLGVLGTLIVVPVFVQGRVPVSIDTAPMLVTAVGAIVLRTIAEVHHRIRVAAIRDADTGLPNERALAAALEGSSGQEANLIAASIERFDLIRHTAGTSLASETVAVTAARIARAADSTVYRVAPDTLAWISSTSIGADELITGIEEDFVRPVMAGNSPIDVRLLFGIAPLGEDAMALTLIERALGAVNAARTEGQGRWWFRGTTADALRDLSIMGEMRLGLEAGELFVAYQPKLHLKSGNITHAEALIRWRHPVEGLIPPDRFIPLAEETGAVRELTRFMLRRVVADIREATRTKLNIGMSVNVSAADIGEEGFADEVIRVLERSSVDPSRLTLEITESAIIHSRETALKVLHTLRDHGLTLSIDDYGTGQSTLSYVRTLPVKELKIDKTFVTHLRENESDRIMVASTIELAHKLGMTVVAEGVEDWDIVTLLAEMGCDYAQGFCIGRGMSFAELSTMANSAVRKAA
jgi:diguanylate cyclase